MSEPATTSCAGSVSATTGGWLAARTVMLAVCVAESPPGSRASMVSVVEPGATPVRVSSAPLTATPAMASSPERAA